jgi:hypothetical protein
MQINMHTCIYIQINIKSMYTYIHVPSKRPSETRAPLEADSALRNSFTDGGGTGNSFFNVAIANSII